MVGWLTPVGGQQGFLMNKGLKKVEIPFEYTNNFIILSVIFNETIPLRFIFDTGAEHTILSKKEISDLLGIQYDHMFRVMGSDMETELIAHLARNIKFSFANKLVASSEDILVLQEDYFRFEEYAGVQVHGILSGNAFSRYLIKINYDKHTITLIPRESAHLEKEGFTPLPLEIFRNKPYLNTLLQLSPDSIAKVKLLVDTGAGLPLLLFSNTHPMLPPPKNAIAANIGMGLSGFLQGFTGRIHGIQFGGLGQGEIITYFQQLDTSRQGLQLNQRNGLIGNSLLNRFLVVIDYQSATIWLKPGPLYREAFIFDRSGMSCIASGPNLKRFIIQTVIPGTPADEAGIKVGDEIVRIGIFPASGYSLSQIHKVFQKKPGKKIKITVQRGTERITASLTLRDIL